MAKFELGTYCGSEKQSPEQNTCSIVPLFRANDSSYIICWILTSRYEIATHTISCESVFFRRLLPIKGEFVVFAISTLPKRFFKLH